MKIFNKAKPWTSKVNFVDDNNLILGYDLDQNCCEHASWFFSNEIKEFSRKEAEDLENSRDNSTIIVMEDWNFDKTFHQKIKVRWIDSGEMIAFRIVKDSEEKFIILYNSHNGYYSHGFQFKENNSEIISGNL